jgi:hypothetical protein
MSCIRMPTGLGRMLAALAIGILLPASALGQESRTTAKAHAGGPPSAKPSGSAQPARDADAGTASRPLGPEEHKARLERYQKWAKDWRARREVHRKARIKRLRYRLHRVLKGAPIPETVRAELTTHARRMARLYRLKELAVEREDEEALTRIDGLLRREGSRHERWLSERQAAPAP